MTYLTVMIHTLFPPGPSESLTLSEDVLGDFLTEAGSFLNTVTTSTRRHSLLKAEAAGIFSTAAEIFALSLGVSVRAMQYISPRQLTGSNPERDLTTRNSASLAELLIQVHRIVGMITILLSILSFLFRSSHGGNKIQILDSESRLCIVLHTYPDLLPNLPVMSPNS